MLVIENEIGNEGIDDHLLRMQQIGQEEIVLMNNGCICCTGKNSGFFKFPMLLIIFISSLFIAVRKDLIDTFNTMFAHESFSKIDWIIIETTGLADPSPLIHSLYMDSECSKKLRLDGVVTVVDAKHFSNHMNYDKEGFIGNIILQLY